MIKGLTVDALGRLVGAATLAYNVDKLWKDPSCGKGLETVVSLVSLAPGWGWAIGAAYFVADEITQDLSGKSIAEHIDN